MKDIYFTQKALGEEKPELLDTSKFLGLPVFPIGFLEDADLDDDDYFVGQVSTADFKGRQSFLPDHAFLYFFIDIDTFEPTVLYTEEEPGEVIEDINELFEGEYGSTEAYQMIFDPALTSGHRVLCDLNPDIALEGYTDTDNKVTLLELDTLVLPEEILQFEEVSGSGARYVFLIDKNDLDARDFSNVELIVCES